MSLDVSLTCPCCKHEVYTSNITHNLNDMATAAGIYKVLWRPEETDVKTAADLIEPLTAGLAMLRAAAVDFSQFDAPNGWGCHKHLVAFVEEYLEACKKYPDSEVSADR
jgi:hypothetical protein